MFVDRCVCHQVPFRLLDRLVEQDHDAQRETTQQIFEALQKRTKCGTGCGMCQPYIKRLIETGQTSFLPFPPDQR